MDTSTSADGHHILVDEELAKDSSTDTDIEVPNAAQSKRAYAAALLVALGFVGVCGVVLRQPAVKNSINDLGSVVEEYDCKAGLSNWDMGWSAGKKRFCCRFMACHGFTHDHFTGGMYAYRHDGAGYHYHHYDHHLQYDGDEHTHNHYHSGSGHHYGGGGYETVVIGNTLQEKSRHKCVDAPDHVRCDNTAEQMGRTGKYPDKFRIEHIGNKICAYRTDSGGPWGLNLVLKCKKDYSQRYSTNDYAPHGYEEVHIGNTLDSHASHKCVSDPGDVHCDDSSEQVGRTGQWKDQFSIYHSHGMICARRTDDDGEWGLNLILKCKKTGSHYRPHTRWYSQAELRAIWEKKWKGRDYYSDQYSQVQLKRMYEQQNWGHDRKTYYHYHQSNDHYETVVIGNTLQENSRHKCVDAPDHVRCDNTAEQMGRTGKYPDKFRIEHIGNKICAYRTDSGGPWGLNLVLKCKKDYSQRYSTNDHAPHGYEEVHIGNTLDSHASHKCVSDPGDVHCDDSSEQVGRTGQWKDQFNIYHHHGMICARRTDDDGEWGLNLILKCKKLY